MESRVYKSCLAKTRASGEGTWPEDALGTSLSVHGLVLLVAAYVVTIAVPLILLPWVLDRRGLLPYNSVRSRLLSWLSFSALVAAISALGGARFVWDSWSVAGFAAFVAFAVWWDIRDMKLRRIPKGRHPDT